MSEIIITFFLSFGVHLWSTVAGGGGAVLIPALLFLGLSPQEAIATNRFSGLSNLFALLSFHRQGHVKWKLGLFLAGFAALGGFIGSALVLRLHTQILEKGIGVLLLLALPMLFVKKDAGLRESARVHTRRKHIGGGALMVLLGALGGFFAGTGIWFSYVFLFYYGLTFLQTAAIQKIIGFAIIIVSLALFIPAGIIHWPIALSMFAGGSLGGFLGVHYATYLGGNGFVRYLFALVVLASAIRILVQ